MKFTETQLRTIFNEAVIAGTVAGQSRLSELKGTVAVKVVDSSTGRVVGTMHDLCGMAYCMIPKSVLSMRLKSVKTLVSEGILSNWDYQGVLNLRLPIIDQSISVREATAQAAVDVLAKYGIKSYMDSRLD